MQLKNGADHYKSCWVQSSLKRENFAIFFSFEKVFERIFNISALLLKNSNEDVSQLKRRRWKVENCSSREKTCIKNTPANAIVHDLEGKFSSHALEWQEKSQIV